MESQELRLFKNIPCPKGDNCTIHKCLFKHKWDEDAIVNGVQSTTSPPRKRQKTSNEEYDPASPALPSDQPPALPELVTNRVPLAAAVPTAVAVPVAQGKSVETTILPQQLRQRVASSQQSTPQTPEKTRKPDGAVGTPTPLSKRSARKPESLNPRHLQPAPATHAVRVQILRLLHEQMKRLNIELTKEANDEDKPLLLSDQEVIWLALDEEESYARSKGSVYSMSIKNRVIAYKKMKVGEWKHLRLKATQVNTIASQTTKPHISPPVVVETGLAPAQEVAFLQRLLTPIDDMSQYGYVPTVPSEDSIQKAREAEETSKGFEVCDRCGTRFQVFPGRREEDGALTSLGDCTHHPGRAYWPERRPGEKTLEGQKRRFRCCGQAIGDSPGCTVVSHHVWKTTDPKRLALLWNFSETPANPGAPTDRAVAFDCEMGYTTRGFELIRLTATSWPDGKELLDVLVRPFGEVLDLNSRYSGVYPEDIANALPLSLTESPPLAQEGQRRQLQIASSPEVARDFLFSLISPDTPLIGHGLENDLNATRIVHPTIVDTILLYPHSKGLPIRNGLKYLMETQLNRRIQLDPAEGQLAGHDSAEDARAAGDLVRLRVRDTWNSMKLSGWTLDEEGQLKAPGGHGKLTEEYIEDRKDGTEAG
jgi:RNA exonuclease 1